ncbi:MAG: hypothetical protein IH840_09880 [Candidatus Heimdallarchaeota archaeon]|nr:hypothetical protein [Candidatus Heimdallarchaeota archaeon]
MLIGIDTFSWYKIIRFSETGILSLNSLLLDSDIFVTREVKKEFEYRFPEYGGILDRVIILPQSDSDFQSYHEFGLDDADASLLEISAKKKYLIVTEDHPMIAEGTKRGLNIIQLGDYLGYLVLNQVITHNNFFKLVRRLRSMRNITKKKERELLQILRT